MNTHLIEYLAQTGWRKESPDSWTLSTSERFYRISFDGEQCSFWAMTPIKVVLHYMSFSHVPVSVIVRAVQSVMELEEKE